MAPNTGGRPEDFSKDIFDGKGQIKPDRWQQLMQLLGRGIHGSAGGGTTIINQRGGGSGATGGGGSGTGTPGTGPSPAPGSPLIPGAVYAPACAGCVPGLFVNYVARGGVPTMNLADNRNGELFATHYVVNLTGGVAALVENWGGLVYFVTGRGLYDNPILWIATAGRVTDYQYDVQNVLGQPLNLDGDPVFTQIVADRGDTKATPSVFATINVVPPMSGMNLGAAIMPSTVLIAGTVPGTSVASSLTASLFGEDAVLTFTNPGETPGAISVQNDGTILINGSPVPAVIGDVEGPASATDNAIARFDTTTGKKIQNSVGILNDAGVISGLTGISTTGTVDFTGAVLSGGSPLVFEGATSDAFETTFAITDPTADRTITFKDGTGTVAFTSDIPATPSGANPTAAVDGTAVNGSASTFLRSDGAPALANPLTPSTGTQTITGSLTLSANLTVNGSTTIGDATGDALTINAGAPTAPNLGTVTPATVVVKTAGNVLGTIPYVAEGFAFGTIVPTAGTSPVADSTSDTLTLTASDSKMVITGTATTDTLDFTAPTLVVGPASATDNAIARFDSTTGKLVQNSVSTISDLGVITTSGIIADDGEITNLTSEGRINFQDGEIFGANPLVFQGGTDDSFTTTFAITDPTANRTVTFKNASGTVAFTSDIPSVTPAALTKTDDTNVTLTLGGTPTTALLQATSITAGWTGTLAVARGGTGAGTLTGYVKGTGTTAMTASSTIPNTDITGLGTISTQNANSVAITGGAIDGTTIGATTRSTVAATTVNANSTVTGTQLISSVSTGTAPLSVTSTTNVANLNASSLSGATFAAPGPIGSGSASTGKFTNLSTTGDTTLGISSSNSFISVSSNPQFLNLLSNTIQFVLTKDSDDIMRISDAADIAAFIGFVPAICPFVDIIVNGERIRVGEAIPNRRSKDLSGVDLLTLPVLTNSVIISEEKPETSYIKRLQLVVSVLGGGTPVILDPMETFPSVLHQGESFTVNFGSLPPTAVSAALLSEGYYIPHPKTA